MDFAKARLKTGYFFLGLFAVFIGLYPLRFIGLPYEESLLGSKPDTLLRSSIYLTAFYTHIFLGGLALLTGFSQFYKTLRRKRLTLHRALGKIYVIAVLLSGLAGLGIAFFATGGIIPSLGFAGLALLWLYTTANAYTSIKKTDIDAHQRWMIRSYALCFAAVTLRLYLPLFTGLLNIEFILSYKIIAWLCWVPNIIVAEIFIVRKLS
ncbi:MAG: DUF2306 domain-containing protein [Eudoraea sp.]|nr:DUF2306 domain-containing protein [Eudoraea sp.]